MKGNPKCGGGICHLSGEYRPAVEERIEGKRIVKAFLDALDLDDVED